MKMMKRLGALAALLLAMGLLCGCGLLNNEYVSIKDYTPSVQEESSDDGKVTVKNFSALKQALLKMAYAGKTEGTIVFDAAYDGDTTADMASACWQVRTQDALCAYCVENMAYEINKIVTISEASVYISYSDVSEAAGAIRHLAFSSGIDDIIRDAFSEGEKKLVVLISRSSYSAEDMAAAVTRVYREDPALVPKEPLASVNMYSGTGAQRLYEISINYGMTSDELDARTAQLQAVDAFAELDTSGMSGAELAYAACEYLMEHCTVSEDKSENTAYAALVGGRANSEGTALAYIVLCRELGVDCRIVYGQEDWIEHCWNIVRIDGSYYHVDITAAIEDGAEAGFLMNDEMAWGHYRWDVSSYPKCSGELRYSDLLFDE